MALLINENCTACDACKPVCPNEAISVGDAIYVIDPLRCTECVGAEDEPQCKLVCPADCIVVNPDFAEIEAHACAVALHHHASLGPNGTIQQMRTLPGGGRDGVVVGGGQGSGERAHEKSGEENTLSEPADFA